MQFRRPVLVNKPFFPHPNGRAMKSRKKSNDLSLSIFLDVWLETKNTFLEELLINPNPSEEENSGQLIT